MKIEDITDKQWEEIESDCIDYVGPMLRQFTISLFTIGMVVGSLITYLVWCMP